MILRVWVGLAWVCWLANFVGLSGYIVGFLGGCWQVSLHGGLDFVYG